MNDAETSNPYASPRTTSESPRRGFQWSLAFAAAVFLTAVLPVAIFFTRRTVLQIATDFDVELPTVTRLALSRLYLLAVCGLFLFTLVKEFALPQRMSRAVNLLVVLLAILLGGGYALLVGWAMMSLIKNLA